MEKVLGDKGIPKGMGHSGRDSRNADAGAGCGSPRPPAGLRAGYSKTLIVFEDLRQLANNALFQG